MCKIKKIRQFLLLISVIFLSSCTIYDLNDSRETSTSETPSDESLTPRSYGETYGAHYLKATGTQKILVIPVTINGYEDNATPSVLSDIQKTFSGNAGDTGWQSLKSFYSTSSFGKLSLNITIASSWYACGFTAAQITAKNLSSNTAEGVTFVLDNAIAWYKRTYNTNCRDFDQDGDGYIDGVWLVYSAPDYSQVASLGSTFWAFTTWDGNNASVSSPTANSFCWASYDFMYEGYGTSKVDAHTFIHETGHMMGLEDYYSTNKKEFSAPMGCLDMMDYNILDHDAYSKFAFGWVTPYKINAAGTLTLRPSESSGDCAIIPTSGGFNGSAFDEYMMIEYYTPTGLNESDSQSRYEGKYPLGFTDSGVRVYHVDSRLCVITETTSGGTDSYSYGPYTDSIVSESTYTTAKGTILANSNTYGDDYMNTIKSPSLIQEMDCTDKRNFAKVSDSTNAATFNKTDYIADNGTLFGNGTSFSLSSYKDSFLYGSSGRMNDGTTLPFKVSFSNESSSGVTLTVESA